MAARKIGVTKRKAAQQAYTSERRWERNRRRRMEKEARRQEFCKTVRQLALDAYGNPIRPRDVSRRIRRLRAA